MRGIRLDGLPEESASPPSSTYGYVDIARWDELDASGTHLHTFLDGVDLSLDKVFAANDDIGMVDRYMLQDGSAYRDRRTGLIPRYKSFGRVEFRQVDHPGETCREYLARVRTVSVRGADGTTGYYEVGR